MIKPFIASSTFLLLSLACLGCGSGGGGESPGTGGAPSTLPSVIAEVRTADALGRLIDGDFPAPTLSSEPVLMGSGQMVRGGSLTLQVVSPVQAATILIGVVGKTGYVALDLPPVAGSMHPAVSLLGGEAGDKYGWLFPESHATQANSLAPLSATTLTLALQLAADFLGDALSVLIAFQTPSGDVSRTSRHGVAINGQAQTSDDFQVSMNWIHPIDLDLHVRTPSGEEIYYGNRSVDGGTLDLDSNPACNIDGINNENVTWTTEKPPCGTYEVVVSVWSACNVTGPFPYTVTIVQGGRTSTYPGSISGGSVTVERRFVGGKVLGVHSNVGAGAGFTEGHAWISVTDYGGAQASTTTYGLWPDDHPAVVDNGAGSDVRVGVEQRNGGYTTTYNRYYCLDSAREVVLRDFLAQTQTWTLTNTCADFASDAVQVAVGERVSASDFVIFGTPRSLGQSIASLESTDPTGAISPVTITGNASSVGSLPSSFDGSPQTP